MTQITIDMGWSMLGFVLLVAVLGLAAGFLAGCECQDRKNTNKLIVTYRKEKL